MLGAPRISLLIGAALVVGCSGAAPAETALVLQSGKTYLIDFSQTDRMTIDGRTKVNSTRVVSERVVVNGGRYKKDALRWNETVVSVIATGDVAYDSKSDKVTEDNAPFALMLGTKYQADIAVDGTVVVSGLKLNEQRLKDSGVGQDTLGLVRALTTEKTIAAGIDAGMRILPSRTIREGDSWTAEIDGVSPLAGPASFEFHWRVESVTAKRIELSFSGVIPTGVSPSLKGGTLNGILRFDRTTKLPELMRMEVKLELAVGDSASSHSTLETSFKLKP